MVGMPYPDRQPGGSQSVSRIDRATAWALGTISNPDRTVLCRTGDVGAYVEANTHQRR